MVSETEWNESDWMYKKKKKNEHDVHTNMLLFRAEIIECKKSNDSDVVVDTRSTDVFRIQVKMYVLLRFHKTLSRIIYITKWLYPTTN